MPTIRKTVGQITLKVLTDVESTTYYYLLVSSMAPAPSAPTTNPPGGGWSTTEPGFFSYVPTQDTVIITGKNYYTRSGSGTEQDPYIYTQVINPVIADIGTYYEKIYGDTKSLYVTVQTLYTDTTFEYSEPSLSSSYEAAKEAYNQAKTALDLAGGTNQYFWTLSSAYSTSVPAGVYVTHIPQSQFKSNPAQGNILMQNTGITIRNGTTSLASLTTSGLIFYQPPTINGSTVTQGNKTMELTATALNFYGSSQSNADVTLNSNGLNITKGSITLGGGSFVVTNNGAITATSGTIGGWYLGDNFLSTYSSGAPRYEEITLSQGIQLPPLPSGQEVDGVLPANEIWAFTVSNQFGVTTGGTLYANGALISGVLSGGTINEIDARLDTLGETVTNQAIAINKIQAICTEEIFYVLTQDTEIVANKHYYTRSGTGTEQDPYIYTQVIIPDVVDIGTYYEESPKITGIVLSKGDYQLSIASDCLTFQQLGENIEDIASLSNQELNIALAKITSNLILGQFKWVIDENGLRLMRI